MKRFSLVFSALFLLAMILAACGPTRLERDFGTSHQLQKFNQIANPEAGKKVEPAEGMDSKAAQATTEKYQKSFEKEPLASGYSLTIGGIGTGTGAAGK